MFVKDYFSLADQSTFVALCVFLSAERVCVCVFMVMKEHVSHSSSMAY